MKTPFARRCLLFVLLGGTPAVTAIAAEAKAPDNTAAAPAPGGHDAASSFQINDYKLRPTDVINVTVADDTTATKDYRVSVKGEVTLVYLNDHPLKLSGLTLKEAADLIRGTYVGEKIYNRPSITVDVREFSVRTVNIIGQVAKPGQVPIPAQKELTLVTAIAAAGGPTERAATEVTITRVLPDGKTQTLDHVDLKGAVLDASKDIPIQEGDTIFLGSSLLSASWQRP